MYRINNINPKIIFSAEIGTNNKIIVLDLTLIHISNIIEFNVFRKPTNVNTTKPYHSNEQISHKVAAFQSMNYRAFFIL